MGQQRFEVVEQQRSCGGPRGEEATREGRVERLVALGRALSDPIRVRMLGIMAEGRGCCDLSDSGAPAGTGEDPGICVCEFEDLFGMGQSKVSYHVRKLKDAGLVREEKRGKWSFYSLDREAVRDLLGEAGEHLGAPDEPREREDGGTPIGRKGPRAIKVVGLAGAEELPAVLSLLDESGLPRDGLDEHLETVLVARAGRDVVGSAALEMYGEAALLRSVAVRRDLRGRGLGRRLTCEALELARKRGVTRVYLLTETADGFFPRFGFRPVPRSLVPEGVRRSVEFVSACPQSARAMVAETTADGVGP